ALFERLKPYAHLDTRAEAVDDGHQPVDREALEIRAAADAREISSRNAGTGLCLAYAQPLRIEHPADLRRKRALELLRVRACIFHRSFTRTPPEIAQRDSMLSCLLAAARGRPGDHVCALGKYRDWTQGTSHRVRMGGNGAVSHHKNQRGCSATPIRQDTSRKRSRGELPRVAVPVVNRGVPIQLRAGILKGFLRLRSDRKRYRIEFPRLQDCVRFTLGTFCVSSCEQRGRQAATDRIP